MAYYFSEEILTNILKRLPVKSLLRLECVQKSWYSIIHSSFFNTIYSHHQNTQKYLMFECYWWHKPYYYEQYLSCLSLRFDDDKGCEEYYSPEFPLPGMSPHPDWSATSNGLICLSIKSERSYYHDDDYYNIIHIRNPAIRKFVTLPPAPRSSPPFLCDYGVIKLAFGFVHNDYKVVKLMSNNWFDEKGITTLVDVYTLSTNSWKVISQDNLLTFGYVEHRSKEVFVNGTAFWVGESLSNGEADKIVCFDTENDVMRILPLPEYFSEGYKRPFLQALGESLALFLKEGLNVFKIWVWEEGSRDHEGFWKPNITVCLEGNFDSRVIGLRNNGDLVILRDSSEHELVCYNVGKKDAADFDVSDLWSSLEINWDLKWDTKREILVINAFTKSLVLLNSSNKMKSSPADPVPRCWACASVDAMSQDS